MGRRQHTELLRIFHLLGVPSLLLATHAHLEPSASFGQVQRELVAPYVSNADVDRLLWRVLRLKNHPLRLQKSIDLRKKES